MTKIYLEDFNDDLTVQVKGNTVDILTLFTILCKELIEKDKYVTSDRLKELIDLSQMKDEERIDLLIKKIEELKNTIEGKEI